MIIIPINLYCQESISQDSIPSVYNEEDLYEDDPYFWSHTKEIGLNFTPLISKFVPFNLGKNEAGLIGLKYKKYYSKRAFTFNFGANVTAEEVDNGNPFLYLGFGIEKRRMITKDLKLAYVSGFELFLGAEGQDGNPFFGFSKSYGFEYHLSKRVYFSTEGAFQIGRSFDDFEPVFIRLAIPIAIFANVRLY